jgi:hypothetical protein
MLEVLKQALDALVVEQYAVKLFNLVPKPHITKAIASLNQAIAELESQEPVALHKSGIANSPSDPEICNERSAQACGPVYCGDSGGYCNKCPKQKSIQAVKPCKGMNCGCTDGRSHSLECLAELAAAIAGGVFVQEALAQPEQEPVAWRTFDGEGGYDYRSYEDNESYADDWNKRNPKHVGWVDELYTHSQRTWVGLTGEEIDACWSKDLWKRNNPHRIFAQAIEAKLKQKNGYAEEKNT